MDTEQDNETRPEDTPPTADAAEATAEGGAADAADGDDVLSVGEDGADAGAEVIALDPAALRAEVQELTARLESIRTERDELTARLRSVSAAYKQQQDDVAATRKRLERLAAEKEEIRRGEVVSALFEPLENLRRSKEAMERTGVDSSHTTGLDMVIRQIASAFENLGMEEVPGKGAKFDPNLHEALTAMPVQDPALDGVVVEVYESGYRLGSRLIRPARVIIGAYSAPPAPEPEAEAETTDAEVEAADAGAPEADEA